MFIRVHSWPNVFLRFAESRADAFRASVKNRECACPMANASYTNLLLDPGSLLRVMRNLALVPGHR